MDGFIATSSIRKLESDYKRPRLPIIACTAHTEIECGDKCISSGMDAFCEKPIRRADLESKIKLVCQK